MVAHVQHPGWYILLQMLTGHHEKVSAHHQEV